MAPFYEVLNSLRDIFIGSITFWFIGHGEKRVTKIKDEPELLTSFKVKK
jgi:hypothetical protein